MRRTPFSTKEIDVCEGAWKVARRSPVAMLTTLETDGSFRMHSMPAEQEEFGGTLWFFAARRADVVQAVENDEHVCVSYVCPDGFVSLSGAATIIDEPIIKRILWTGTIAKRFPMGPTSQEVVLVKVDTDHAEYWNVPGAAPAQRHPFGPARH